MAYTLKQREAEEATPLGLIADDIELAAKVHYSCFPRGYSNDLLDIAVKTRPFGKVGGDYCTILPIDENRLVVCMCDAVGHGIASALFAARVNTFVLTYAMKRTDPCMLISALNDFLCQRLSGTGIFTTFSTISFDLDSMEMAFVGAAHPPALYYSAGTGEVEFLPSQTTFLGIMDNLPEVCSPHRRNLGSGDRIILYTDGVIEARDAGGEFFGTEVLGEFARSNPGLTPAAMNDALLEKVLAHCNGRPTDDILLMSIAIK